MLDKGVNLLACDSGGYDCLTVALRRALPQLQVALPPKVYDGIIHDDAELFMFVLLQIMLMQNAKEHRVRLFEDVLRNGDLIVHACSR